MNSAAIHLKVDTVTGGDGAIALGDVMEDDRRDGLGRVRPCLVKGT